MFFLYVYIRLGVGVKERHRRGCPAHVDLLVTSDIIPGPSVAELKPSEKSHNRTAVRCSLVSLADTSNTKAAQILSQLLISAYWNSYKLLCFDFLFCPCSLFCLLYMGKVVGPVELPSQMTVATVPHRNNFVASFSFFSCEMNSFSDCICT